MWIMLKTLALLIGGAVPLAVLFVALWFLRPSIPYVLRSELEQLAASAPYNGPKLASEICGRPVDYLGGLDPGSPATALPQAKLLSWQLFCPMEGTTSARIVGVGASQDGRALTGRCEATITFKYQFTWSYNGRATVLESSFPERPKVVPGTNKQSR